MACPPYSNPCSVAGTLWISFQGQESTCGRCVYPYASVPESDKCKYREKIVRVLTANGLLFAVLLGGDDRITTATDFLELFAVENPYAPAQRFDEFVVLQLICGLCDGGASGSE